MKIRLTRIMVTEYEVDESVYPENWTYEEMAQSDADQYDIEALFDTLEKDLVSWETIDEVGNVVSSGKSSFGYK